MPNETSSDYSSYNLNLSEANFISDLTIENTVDWSSDIVKQNSTGLFIMLDERINRLCKKSSKEIVIKIGRIEYVFTFEEFVTLISKWNKLRLDFLDLTNGDEKMQRKIINYFKGKEVNDNKNK